MLRNCRTIICTIWLAFFAGSFVVKSCNTPSIAAIFRLAANKKFYAILFILFCDSSLERQEAGTLTIDFLDEKIRRCIEAERREQMAGVELFVLQYYRDRLAAKQNNG